MQKEIQNRKYHIVFLGEAGFPLGLGAVQRMILMAKALVFADCKVSVVCRKGLWEKNSQSNLDSKGNFEGIDYLYTSIDVYRPKGFFSRNMQKLKGMYGEYKYLKHLKKHNNIQGAIISNMRSAHVLRYRIYSQLIGFPIILNFVELASSMKGRDSFFIKINDYLYDNYIVKIVDGALPISNKLMEYYMALSPKRPILKLPILCDFEKFNIETKDNSELLFLYSGAASYLELVEFLIASFDQLKNLQDHIFLQLVLGGKVEELNRVEQQIAKADNKDHIRLVTNVPHKKIPAHYARATALLIPLRPSIQDEARFPHKIGEYLASGRPMITTAFGEINNYNFIDEETALVAKEYSVPQFAEKMMYVIDNPQKAKLIGQRGRQMGLDNFDYKKHGRPMLNYFSSLGHK